MVKIEINYSELMETFTLLLEYLSGKRARNADEYYRFTVCDADSRLLHRLLRESLAWISANAVKIWGGSVIMDDTIKIGFGFGSEEGDDLARTDEFRWMVTDLLIYRMIFLWLRLTGSLEALQWESRSVSLLEKLSEMEHRLKLTKGLCVRRTFPFGNF